MSESYTSCHVFAQMALLVGAIFSALLMFASSNAGAHTGLQTETLDLQTQLAALRADHSEFRSDVTAAHSSLLAAHNELSSKVLPNVTTRSDPAPVPPTLQSGPNITVWSQELMKCADEGTTCACTGTVRYAVSATAGSRVILRAGPSILCSISIFGRDPAPNEPKVCFCDGVIGKISQPAPVSLVGQLKKKVVRAFTSSFDMGSTRQWCQKLRSTPGVGLGPNLHRATNGMLALKSTRDVPIHIFYRFSGTSRHDRLPLRTPTLGAISLVRALRATPQDVRQHISLHMLYNGDDKMADSYRSWFGKQTDGIQKFHFQTISHGNMESYLDMIDAIRQTTDIPRAMIFLLEEDYWINRMDMFSTMRDFWDAYDPCAAVPYDYPDRYSRIGDTLFNKNVILQAPHAHWRTVESATVTYILRLDVFQELDRKNQLVTPSNDYAASNKISQDLGLWGPVEAFASHVHKDAEDLSVCGFTSYDFDCNAIMKTLCKHAIELTFPLDLKRQVGCS